ncbi:MAG TPA: sulfatase-like hydrolase/transferase [Spirochaetota bacterium]|nr:sulfatase-like hydrolase/transferase [Spirochaetota bacterium]
MKRFFTSITESYRNNVLTFIFLSMIVILLMAGYRLEIHALIMERYPEMGAMGFFEYLRLSMRYDAAAILCCTVFLFVMTALMVKRKRLFVAAASIFLVVMTVFLLISIDFFKTYETTFQTGFLGKEHATAITRILASISSEISRGLIAKMALTSTVIMVLTFISASDWFASGLGGILTSEKRPRIRRAFLSLPPAVGLSLAAIMIAGASEDQYAEAARGFSAEPTRAMTSNLREFSLNPLYNLLVPGGEAAPSAQLTAPANQGDMERLDTASEKFPGNLGPVTAVPRGKRYNIIFFFFESTPVKYLGLTVNGKAVAPTWNRLMENAFVSLDHYANYPLSANALLSVMTSSYSMHAKDPVIEKYPEIRLKTASEILKENGYRTCLLHTGTLEYAGQDRFLKNRKFDRIYQYRALKKPPYTEWVGWGLHERAMIEPGVEFMKSDPAAPFFVVYMPVNPHHPYPIPDESFRITDPIDDSKVFQGKNWMKYLNSLHYADAILGEIVDRLEAEGLLESTLLFLFSDHGEAFYQHRQNYNHPLFLYEENVRVPFIIYSKKFFPEPLRYRGISRHIDILPTMLDILSIENDRPMEGVALFSRHARQMAVLQTTWMDNMYSVRDGKWKYILRTKDSWEELYDIEKDPDEKNNLAGMDCTVAGYYRGIAYKAMRYDQGFYEKTLRNYGTARKTAMSEEPGKIDLEGGAQERN